MPQSWDSVLSDIQKNKFSPIYFLHGDEPYFIDLIVDHIEKNAIEESAKSFNQIVLYGKDVDMNQILTQARRFPMMSERQVVLVKEAQEIRDLAKEAGQTLLEGYINQPQASTILVFAHKHKAFDQRKKIAKELNKKAVVVQSKRLYDNQIPDWIKTFIGQRGHSIEEKAAHMLSEYIGNNLERIVNEVDKILINFKEKVYITPDLIEKYVGISKEYNSFELQKALAVRDVYKANLIVNYFGANPKSNPLILTIAFLYTFFTKLLLVHSANDQSSGALASQLRISPFFVKEYITASKNYPKGKVIANIHHLRHADLKSKGVNANNIDNGELLKELIFLLMH
ncbi:MAG: DNA polymerase III subunit delta [Cyclobacteriaceae bacterium]